MAGLYKRTVEDVTSILTHAKQKNEDVNSVTQIFYYPSESNSLENKENFRLMALDEDFIKKLENGERLTFKGCDEEKVVLCTDDETYEVKEGEISNSLVLCPNLLYCKDLDNSNSDERTLKEQMISGIHQTYLELRLTFPRLSKLKAVLTQALYSGPNQEDADSHEGFYLYELLDLIQCSRNELVAHLSEIKAISINDKWRLLSLDYTAEVFSYMISLIERQNWQKINGPETKKLLKPLVPDFIISHILKHYATQCSEDENLYEFNEYLVSRCFAELLLKTAEGKFRFNEFMMAWEQCLNPVIKADLDNLKGLALIEKEDGQQKVIHLFPEYDLPESVNERFRLLFKRKEKWTLDEITPYIQNLATKTTNVNAMLTKFTRSSTVKGVRTYSARYAK